MSSHPPTTNLFTNAQNTVAFQEGQEIFHEGDEGDAMYVVQQGEVDIVVGNNVVETVGPKGMFGEMALIDQSPRSSTAVARTACVVVKVRPAEFMFMVRQTPFFAMDVLKLVTYRLREMNARLKAYEEASLTK